MTRKNLKKLSPERQKVVRQREQNAVVEHRRRRKIKAIEYKGGKCSRCGYSKCVGALEFHHRDKQIKDHTLTGERGGSMDFRLSWYRIKKELDKCDLVCANCHRELEEGLYHGQVN